MNVSRRHLAGRGEEIGMHLCRNSDVFARPHACHFSAPCQGDNCSPSFDFRPICAALKLYLQLIQHICIEYVQCLFISRAHYAIRPTLPRPCLLARMLLSCLIGNCCSLLRFRHLQVVSGNAASCLFLFSHHYMSHIQAWEAQLSADLHWRMLGGYDQGMQSRHWKPRRL